jgi:hypothetical protein
MPKQMPKVVDCDMADCTFNDALECSAPEGIHVGKHEAHPDCKTFAAR